MKPLTVEEGLLEEVVDIAGKYQNRCDRSKVLPNSYWSRTQAMAATHDTARLEEK